MRAATTPHPADLVDRGRYPIDDPESPACRALVGRCRRDLAISGALALPGFLTAEATALLAAEAETLEPFAHRYEAEHTIYFAPPDQNLAPDHPGRRMVRSAKRGVPYDRVPPDALLRALYEWDALLDFVAAVLGETVLYRHDDPLAALNVNVHGAGEELGWHFDRTDFAITLSLRQNEAGGIFEYVPDLRTDEGEDIAGIAAALDGDRRGVRVMDAAPGTFALFRGHYSLHRVTPGEGAATRLMAALSYVREPNVQFSAYARKLFYGRETGRAAIG